MVKPKIKRRDQKIGSGKILNLACGCDFFGTGYGRPFGDFEAMRRDWQDAEVRRLVYEQHWRKWGRSSRPFAEIAFGPTGEDNPGFPRNWGDEDDEWVVACNTYDEESRASWEREIAPKFRYKSAVDPDDED